MDFKKDSTSGNLRYPIWSSFLGLKSFCVKNKKSFKFYEKINSIAVTQ